MDHLPNFKYITGPYPRIPIISYQPYDGLDFDGYQDRQGFQAERLYNRDFTQHPRQRTAVFLQTWLFFGSLYEIFKLQLNGPADLSQFVTEDEHGLRVSTSTLNELITKWATEIQELGQKTPEASRARFLKVGTVQNTTHKIYHNLLTVNNSPLPYEITLSLGILGATIDFAFKSIWIVDHERDWGLGSLAATRMMEAGWCPRDIAVGRQVLSEIPLYCASFLERRSVPFDHWNCSEQTCRLNNINESTYVTQHRWKDCRCYDVVPDQAEIRRILDEGGIPIVYLTSPGMDAQGNRRLDVKVKAGMTMIHGYISVSHVWSDGLGNPRANSLPLCQLQYLYDKLVDMEWNDVYSVLRTTGDNFEWQDKYDKRAVEVIGAAFKVFEPGLRRVVNPIRQYRQKPLALWIDTLCVPIEKRYRTLAIGRMKEVYAKADMSIVLDSELQAFDFQGCPDEEIAIRIGLSGWMRRAWTFQEGFLATTWLRFLFHDGPAALPLWRKELISHTASSGYSMPGLSDKSEKFNAKIVKWVGSEYQAPLKIPQSRQDELRGKQTFFTVSYRMTEEAKTFFKGIKALWEYAAPNSAPSVIVSRMIAVWNTMAIRSTSREGDKFVCFAIACALGSNQRQQVESLMAKESTERVRHWVRTQSVVPSGLLFVAGERYTDPGFRWVPKGIWQFAIEDDGYAERQRGGDMLLFEKPGYMIHCASWQVSESRNFLILDTESQLRYSVKLIDPLDSASLSLIRQPGGLAVILQQRVGSSKIDGGNIKTMGALLSGAVRTGQQRENPLHGQFVGRVEVRLAVDELVGVHAFPATRLEDYQKWTIS